MQALIAALIAALILAQPAHAEELEPPADVNDGEDYTVAVADSLPDGDIEVGVGYSATDGGRAVRRRRAQFSGDSLELAVRDGSGDALAGSALEGAAGGGRFGLGRASPVWGRGLVVGDPLEPWSRRERAPRRRADGDVAWYRAEREGLRFGALCGGFAHRTRAGLELGAADFGAGIAGDDAGFAGASTWWARSDSAGTRSAELALDHARRWRFETAIERATGRARLGAWVRAGLAGHRPLGDPRRAGPSRALSLSADLPFDGWLHTGQSRAPARTADTTGGGRRAAGRSGGRRSGAAGRSPARIVALAALWRFASSANGARAMLEVEHALPQHASVVAGFEEQHGTRRDPAFATSSAAREARAFRQGAWGEWRAAAGPLSLAWRHERWGTGAWTRSAVRVVSTARIAAMSRGGLGIQVTQAVFRVHRGEHVYVPEIEADRLVLRALSGDGERMRVELRVPFARGFVQASLNQTTSGAQVPRRQWTLEWTRRAHAGRAL